VNQKLALRILEKRQCVVKTAATGAEVLRALEDRSFDVILMDVQMPEMDGFEATAAIREKEKSTQQHVPIIAVTAHALKGDRERCLAAGMDSYISKPIDPKELFAAITQMVPDRQHTRLEIEAPGSEAPLDETSLREKIDNDEQLLQELIQLFQLDCPPLLQQIAEAIEADDPKPLELAAHALRGAIGAFAAKPASDAALKLERMAREHQTTGARHAYTVLQLELQRLQVALAALSFQGAGKSVK
jgi:CheY-like chemotaxis protein/HPt (histidine-containing phosphotransfer) domain-containing protein